ncbi:MAG: ABC transporter permease [Oscillospiraceae bacterium]|nr:ABC transporter permease [Oscillospiraceae bacterium]
MLTVMRHELNMQDRSFSTYLFGFFLLETVGIAAMIYNINNKMANFEYCLSTITLVFVLIIPIITMKSIAEERKLRTDQLLYSLPLSMWDIVLGKFFATLVNFMLPLTFVAVYPLLFKRYGNVFLRTSYGSLIAFVFLGAALIAVGMFISSLTENQGIAAGISAVLIALNYYSVDLANYTSSTKQGSLIAVMVFSVIVGFIVRYLTKSTAGGILAAAILAGIAGIVYAIKSVLFEGLVPKIMSRISLFQRFYSFVNGDFDVTAIVYYISVTALFLFLCVQSLEKRRYS